MKKHNLAAAMKPLDRTATMSPPVEAARKPRDFRQPSREGKRPLIAYFSPECIRQFKQIALDHDTTQQALLAEALNDLFQKYGKPTLA